jgi:hypothetical protein
VNDFHSKIKFRRSHRRGVAWPDLGDAGGLGEDDDHGGILVLVLDCAREGI